MQVFHQSDQSFYMDILASKFLLPSTNTKNFNQNPSETETLPYIFMGCMDEEYRIDHLLPFTFIFPMDILFDRCFYTNTSHSAGNTETSTYYKKNTPLPEIDVALRTLFLQSLETENMIKKVDKRKKKTNQADQRFPYFTVFQEIFFKKRVDMKKATHLVLPTGIPNDDINYIKKHYPQMQLVLRQN